jgi:Fe(3+) dicitrate transport protein
LQLGKIQAIPGLRYEKMEIDRINYGNADPNRTGVNATLTNNHAEAIIPGLGVQYEFTKALQAFAGIHRGFAPAGASVGTDPEKSINYELGTRLNTSRLSAQAIIFFNDYENLLGSDLSAAGGCCTGDQFNAGQAEIYGLEGELNYLFVLPSSRFSLPVSLAYTYTDGQFLSSFAATNEDWGNVQIGDHLPYLAKHQLTANVSLEHKKFNLNVSSKYMGMMRTQPGQGEAQPTERVGSNVIIDLSGCYTLTRHLKLVMGVYNITNEVYAVARRPAGLRPGMPRSYQVGVIAKF